MLSPPLVKEDDLFTRSDLAAHVLAFGLFAVLLYLVWTRPRVRFGTLGLALATAGLAFGYSALLETLQLFIPQRQFSVQDLGANLLGALLGYGLARWAVPGSGRRPHFGGRTNSW
jgi:VanZ family protein